MRLRWHLAGLVLLLPAAAQAHSGVADRVAALLPPLVLALAWLAYAWGARRRRPGLGRQVAFHAGMALSALTLYGPLDRLAHESTALHMVQHMLLIAVVPPLLVLGSPLGPWCAAAGRWLHRPARWVVRMGRHPAACATAHAIAIWFWHAPGPYLAALSHAGVHWLAHASFGFTALLFWQAVLRPGRTTTLAATMALLATLMHTGALGALLTLARAPLYLAESRDLADQQLAGLVMWVPGGLVYLAAAALLMARTGWHESALMAQPSGTSHRR